MSNDEMTTQATPAPDEVLAKIVKYDDGYHVIDHDGTEGPVCKIVDDGKTIALTANSSNRKWYNIAKAEAEISEKGHVDLRYKESKVLGKSSAPKMPNAKLISYLSEEEQEEYKAIIARAVAAKEADKKPMTEMEKAQAAFAKAKAKYEALLAQAEGGNE